MAEIAAKQQFHLEFDCKGDCNAAFWLCEKAPSVIKQKSHHPPAIIIQQGDKAVCDVLTQMGANLSIGSEQVDAKHAPLHAVTIDGSQIPDIIPILSVVAAVSQGETHIVNAGRLRIKATEVSESSAQDV